MPVERCFVVRLSLSTGKGSLDFYVGSSQMVRRSVLAMFGVVAIVLGCVVVSMPAGAVVDSATIVPSPNAGTSTDHLLSVSCVSATECVAVGYTIGSAYEALAMVWDGVDWSIVPIPNAGSYDRLLSSVSCVSATECVAVGYTITNGVYEALAMVWNGTVWSIMDSPNAGTIWDELLSVSCVSASECVAVGHTKAGSVWETLVTVWDGIEWSIVSSPNAGNLGDELFSVSCVSGSDCVAVGYTGAGNNVYETLVMSLTGSEPAPITTTTAPSDQVAPAYTG